MIEDGLNPEDLLGKRFGHHLDFWSLSEGRLIQRVDLGDEHQMVLEVRPAHDPRQTWGFVGVVISVKDLSASVWLWHREDDRWTAKKVITIPAEPAETDQLPPALQPFGAAPPLVSDIDLSVDDRWLYVSCWGTGELKQYDVSDPHNPKETGSVRLGGIVSRTPHPAVPELSLAGAPQMVEVSRDGRRVYFTNSLYASWDDIFYPDGVGAWMARIDADTESGGMSLDLRRPRGRRRGRAVGRQPRELLPGLGWAVPWLWVSSGPHLRPVQATRPFPNSFHPMGVNSPTKPGAFGYLALDDDPRRGWRARVYPHPKDT